MLSLPPYSGWYTPTIVKLCPLILIFWSSGLIAPKKYLRTASPITHTRDWLRTSASVIPRPSVICRALASAQPWSMKKALPPLFMSIVFVRYFSVMLPAHTYFPNAERVSPTWLSQKSITSSYRRLLFV